MLGERLLDGRERALRLSKLLAQPRQRRLGVASLDDSRRFRRSLVLETILQSASSQPAADAAMLSFFETELLDNAQWKNQVAQMGENKWVRRFVEVKGSVGGGGGGAAAKK